MRELFIGLTQREASAVPTQYGIQKQKRTTDRVRFSAGHKLVVALISSVRSCIHSPDDALLAAMFFVLSKNEKVELYRLRALFGFLSTLRPFFVVLIT